MATETEFKTEIGFLPNSFERIARTAEALTNYRRPDGD